MKIPAPPVPRNLVEWAAIAGFCLGASCLTVHALL